MIIIPKEKRPAFVDWLKSEAGVKLDSELADKWGERRETVSRIRNGKASHCNSFVLLTLENLDLRPSELKERIAKL